MCRFITRLALTNLVTLVVGLALLSNAASATNILWDGTGATWNSAGPWSLFSNAVTPDPPAKPVATDVAIFNITTVTLPQTVNLDSPQSALGLVFNSTGTVLIESTSVGGSANSLTLGANGITHGAGAGADTISAPVILSAPQTWVNNSSGIFTASGGVNLQANGLTIDGAATTTFSGALSGTGGVTKNGSAGLRLNASNAFTGGVTINNGPVILGNAGALNATTPNAVSFGANSIGALTLNGNSVTVSGLTTNATVGSPLVENGTASAATLTVNNAVNNTFDGLLRDGAGGGPLSLTKTGTGTLTLSNANTFTGGVTVQQGTLQIPTINNFGTNGTLGHSSSVTLGSSGQIGTLEYAGATGSSNMPITLAAGGNGAIQVDSAGFLTLIGNIGGSGGLTKLGAGTLTFSNSNTFTGPVAINAGTLQLNGAGALTAAGNISIATTSGNLGTLALSGASSNVTQAGASTLTVGNSGTGTAALNVATTAGGATFSTGTGLFTISTTGTVTIGSGANTGTLSANGNTTVDGGVLQRESGSTFALAAGQTMTIQNGGRASFTGDYTTASNSIYNIGGTNSKLETLGGGALNLDNGAQVNVTPSGLLSLAGNLEVGNGTSGTLSVNGAGANITQTGAGTLTVGAASGGTGAINIGTATTGGTLTSGSGLFTINKTGTVTVGSATTNGTLNVGGNITIEGVLTRGSGSTFALADGKTMTIQNGGRATFTDLYETAANAIYNITAGSTLESPSGGALNLDNGSQVNLSSGGVLSATSLTVGNILGNGTLSIQGGIGSGGHIVVQNHSTVNVGTTVSGSTLDVIDYLDRSGSDLTIDGTSIVNIGSATTTGGLFFIWNVNVDGGVLQLNRGSRLVLDPNREQEHFIVQNGGRVTFDLEGQSYVTSGDIFATPGGAHYDIIGANSKWELVDGSGLDIEYSDHLRVDSGGLLSVAGNVTVGGGFDYVRSGLSGDSDCRVYIGSGGTLTVAGNVTVGELGDPMDHDIVLTIAGGTLTANALVINAHSTFLFTNGTLGITGVAGLSLGPTSYLGTNFSVDVSHNLNVTNTTTIPVGASLTVDGGTFNTGNLVVNGTFRFYSGTLGITGPAGLTVGAGGLLGSTLVLNANQTLHVTSTLTVNAGAKLIATSGGLSAGSLVNNGDLVAIDTAIGGPVVNNNAVTVVGNVDFNGLVSGPGDFFGPGTAHFNGGMAPGASPAEVTFEGNLALADTNTLFIEIGGTTPGSQYDLLTIDGSATLDGILNVSLITGFTPIGGQQFTILTASSIVNNGFELAGTAASSFSLLVNSTSVILQAIGLAGDYNNNGIVDAADYVLWRKNNNTAVTLPNDATPGTSPADYTVWRSHFGQPPGSGSGANVNAAVPEPSTLVMLVLAVAGVCSRRRRAA